VGDGTAGEVSVRVEAYVCLDTPIEGEGGGLTASGAAQRFRVIDWRVILSVNKSTRGLT